MPKAVLAGLKKREVDISVVCAMLDTGGSTGRLRREYDIRAPGDLRRALIALANTSPVMEKLFDYRFQVGELAGHNFANLLIMALELNCKNYEDAVYELKQFLNVQHEVFPVTLDKSEVCACLENGRVVKGEGRIDRPEHDPNLRIEKIFLEPPAQAYHPALKAIKVADLIVVGPGDLYSTLAQILLVGGVAKTIRDSKAKTAYIVNLMTKKGETNDFSVQDFSSQIEQWLGSKLEFVVYNGRLPSSSRVKKYKKSHPELINVVQPKDSLPGGEFMARDLIWEEGPIEHDPDKVADIILSLLKKQ